MTATVVEVRCPDCGHAMPVELSFAPAERRAEGGVVIDVTAFPDLMGRFERHVALHPELHPTLLS